MRLLRRRWLPKQLPASFLERRSSLRRGRQIWRRRPRPRRAVRTAGGSHCFSCGRNVDAPAAGAQVPADAPATGPPERLRVPRVRILICMCYSCVFTLSLSRESTLVFCSNFLQELQVCVQWSPRWRARRSARRYAFRSDRECSVFVPS